MKNIDEVNEKLESLLANAKDKETIDAIGTIKEKLDEANKEAEKNKADFEALQAENADLLKDYRKAVKHSSFSSQESKSGNGSPQERSWEQFLEDYTAKKKKE